MAKVHRVTEFAYARNEGLWVGEDTFQARAVRIAGEECRQARIAPPREDGKQLVPGAARQLHLVHVVKGQNVHARKALGQGCRIKSSLALLVLFVEPKAVKCANSASSIEAFGKEKK